VQNTTTEASSRMSRNSERGDHEGIDADSNLRNTLALALMIISKPYLLARVSHIVLPG
jgi:hypothetical protein